MSQKVPLVLLPSLARVLEAGGTRPGYDHDRDDSAPDGGGVQFDAFGCPVGRGSHSCDV